MPSKDQILLEETAIHLQRACENLKVFAEESAGSSSVIRDTEILVKVLDLLLPLKTKIANSISEVRVRIRNNERIQPAKKRAIKKIHNEKKRLGLE